MGTIKVGNKNCCAYFVLYLAKVAAVNSDCYRPMGWEREKTLRPVLWITYGQMEPACSLLLRITAT